MMMDLSSNYFHVTTLVRICADNGPLDCIALRKGLRQMEVVL